VQQWLTWGGGTTDLAIIPQWCRLVTNVINIGSYYITTDNAQGLRLPA
jgi:cell division ATPase FtsA